MSLLCEQIAGGRAQVAVTTPGRGELRFCRRDDLAYRPGQHGSADVQLARVGLAERFAGKVHGKQAGIVYVDSLRSRDCGGYGGSLLQAAACGGEFVSQLCEMEEQSHAVCRCADPVLGLEMRSVRHPAVKRRDLLPVRPEQQIPPLRYG